MEGDEDRDVLEGANFFRLEHFNRGFEFIKDLSQVVDIDVDKRPDIRDTKVFKAADGVDVVSD